MLVYHGTTKSQAEAFLLNGIDAHLLHPRNISGPQSNTPGIFVTPVLEVAKQFGRSVVAIEVEYSDLSVPPNLALAGADLTAALNNPLEQQAFLTKRIEPGQVTLAYHEEPRHFT